MKKIFSRIFSRIFNSEIIYTIVPFTEKYEAIKKQRVHWSYLHGKIETDAGFDIFGIKERIPTKDGIYKCVFEKKECTMFLWNRMGSSPSGLVVYNDDKNAYEDAENKYKNKEMFI